MFNDFEYEAITLNTVLWSPPFILYQLTRVQDLWFDAIMYLIILYAYYYTMWNLVLFIYGIGTNFTQDELFNPKYYSYLFKIREIDTSGAIPGERVADPLVKYVNPNDCGYSQNGKTF